MKDIFAPDTGKREAVQVPHEKVYMVRLTEGEYRKALADDDIPLWLLHIIDSARAMETYHHPADCVCWFCEAVQDFRALEAK